MYCTKCGAANDDNAWKCTKCGEALEHLPAAGQREPVKVNNYLVPAIITTVFCCVPFGIVAVVYAAQANSKASSGDIDGAVASSNKAKAWTWAAFGVGAVFGVLWLALQIAGVMLAHNR